jgi:serine/threonine protein kinase
VTPRNDSQEKLRPQEGGVTPEPATRIERGPGSGSVPTWAPGAHFSSYEIESRLARGGMAEVWRAKITGLDKRIVIKTMLTQFQERPDVVAMFVNEAALAARLSHPNIVDVIDFGQLEGRYYIAMEYVSGLTLRFALKRTHARGELLPVAAVLHLMRDVCEALDHLHELEDGQGPMGLVHRDLSPDNIVVSTGGSAKLIDFGAARATARMPPPRVFVGKFRYAAPERIHLKGEDRRSDVYSVGVILYECLTGTRAFEGSDPEIIAAVMASNGCDPRGKVPSLPASVASVVKKATARNAEDRFASARDLGIALARCLVELAASNKEREVTGALSWILEDSKTPSPVLVERDVDPAREAVPEAFEPPSPSEVSPDMRLNEREIIDASGPIGTVVDLSPTEVNTRRVVLPVPPEAYRSARKESGVFDISSVGVPTVSIFDRRAASRRAAPTSFIDAAAAAGGSSVLGWRTSPSPTSTSTTKARTTKRAQLERAVEFFDRGLALRLEGHYGQALDAWERALALAPSNELYQSHVRRLRAQLGALRANAR